MLSNVTGLPTKLVNPAPSALCLIIRMVRDKRNNLGRGFQIDHNRDYHDRNRRGLCYTSLLTSFQSTLTGANESQVMLLKASTLWFQDSRGPVSEYTLAH
jgi:hypothetical protein